MLEVSQDGSGACRPGTDEYLRFDEHGQSGTARVLATGRPLVVPDARTSGELVPGRAAEHGIASALFVPLSYAGELRDVVILGWSEPRDITPEDVATAELAAASAAAGLARIEADERRAAGSIQDRAVVRAASALNASLDLQEILLHARPRGRARARRRDVGRLPRQRGGRARSRPPATASPRTGTASSSVPARAPPATCSSPAGRSSPTTTCTRSSTSPSSPRRSGVLSALAVPMEWGGELRGVLSIGWTSRRRVHDDDLRTLEAIAGLATVACRNAEAYEHVQHVARTDALTGVLNHGAMQVRIREEIARARRDQHAARRRDPRPRRLQARQRHARPRRRRRAAAPRRPGAAGRAAPVRPGRPLRRRRVRAAAARLRRGDDHARSPSAAATSIGGECSIGVAAWHDGLDADGLLEQADRALMLAKRTGKGRVAVANPEVERELALLQSRSGSPAAVQALAAAIEERDNYTHEHSELVVPALARRRDDARAAARRRRERSRTPRCCTTSASSRCRPSCCTSRAR